MAKLGNAPCPRRNDWIFGNVTGDGARMYAVLSLSARRATLLDTARLTRLTIPTARFSSASFRIYDAPARIRAKTLRRRAQWYRSLGLTGRAIATAIAHADTLKAKP
jgi:hypothetical protein